MDLMDKDDAILSQALDLFETFENGICNEDSLLSQTLDSIERGDLFDTMTNSQFVSTANELQQGDYGDFNLDLMEMDKKSVKKDTCFGGTDLTIVENDNTCVKKDTRFGGTVSNADLDELVKNQKSKNTDRNTQWALRAFEAWRTSKKETGEVIPELHELDINQHLSRFVVEVRKQDGDYFPPESLYHLVCGLLRQLRETGITDKNFLDEKNDEFVRFRSVLDAQMKFLTKEEIGGTRKEAQPVSEDDEVLMWEKCVFGSHSAKTLQYTMFYYNCKLFGLRAFDEHRNLETSQFEFGTDKEGPFVFFKGKNSKTYNGGLKHRRIDPKEIKHYNNEQNIVHLYEQFVKSVGEGPFYRRPLTGINGEFRFSNQVVGVNKLKTFMKEKCKLAGLEGRYTNHSGKKTCATTLYQNDVPEQEIMKRTGHRSLNGVRKYQKPSSSMLVEISNKLNPPKPDMVASPVLGIMFLTTVFSSFEEFCTLKIKYICAFLSFWLFLHFSGMSIPGGITIGEG